MILLLRKRRLLLLFFLLADIVLSLTVAERLVRWELSFIKNQW